MTQHEPVARIEALCRNGRQEVPMEPFQPQHLCSAHDLRRGLGAAFLMAGPQLRPRHLAELIF
jgi:hypothetical protein